MAAHPLAAGWLLGHLYLAGMGAIRMRPGAAATRGSAPRSSAPWLSHWALPPACAPSCTAHAVFVLHALTDSRVARGLTVCASCGCWHLATLTYPSLTTITERCTSSVYTHHNCCVVLFVLRMLCSLWGRMCPWNGLLVQPPDYRPSCACSPVEPH